MSFEGFDQYLCLNGHLREFDCGDPTFRKCSCGQPFIFRHTVDQTNGYDKSNPWSCRYPFEIQQDAVYETCNLGYMHVITETIYKIPAQ